MFPVQTILHATDFSARSEVAFQLACSLARDHGARLVVLHVAQPPVVIYDDQGSLLPLPADYREAAREQLSALRASDPTVRVEHWVEEGEASAAILRVAGEIKADLIVIGTHGRTGLDRLLIGSVAEDVLRRAPCPVLTVKAPPPKEVAVGHAPVREPENVPSA